MLPFFGAPFSALSLMLYKFPKMMIASTANTATNFISVCQKSFQRYMYLFGYGACGSFLSFETLVSNRYHYFTRIGLFPCFSLWSLVEIEKLQLVCRRQSREWWRERAVPILLVPIFPPRQLRQKCFTAIAIANVIASASVVATSWRLKTVSWNYSVVTPKALYMQLFQGMY